METMDYIKRLFKDEINKGNYEYILNKKKNEGLYVIKQRDFSFSDCDITDYLRFGEKFNKVVSEFKSVLDNDFKDYTDKFNYNIQTLKIYDYKFDLYTKIKDFFSLSGSSNAYYGCYTNIIQLEKDFSKKPEKIKRTVMHELLHMASCQDMIFAGFSQDVMTDNGCKLVGNAVNEGATEYLNIKYFSHEETEAYKQQVHLVHGISRIIGEDRLVENYFKKGLLGLIKELSKYCDKDKAIEIILEMDNNLKYGQDYIGKKKNKNVKEMIADVYENKISNLLAQGKISQERFEKEKFLFCDTFKKSDKNFTDASKVIEYDDYIMIEEDNKNVKIKREDNILKFIPDEVINRKVK